MLVQISIYTFIWFDFVWEAHRLKQLYFYFIVPLNVPDAHGFVEEDHRVY